MTCSLRLSGIVSGQGAKRLYPVQPLRDPVPTGAGQVHHFCSRFARAKMVSTVAPQGAKVDCIGSPWSSAYQYPRTSRIPADASNHTRLSRLRTPTQFPAGFRGARSCTPPPHDRCETLRLHSQQYRRSESVLHRHHVERPSAARGAQPRRLLTHAALDTVASDCRRRVCEREARARLRAISQDRVGLRVRGATLQVKRVMPRA